MHACTPTDPPRRRLPDPTAIPPELAPLRRWLPWSFGPTRPDGRRAKRPVHPTTGRPADAHDPRHLDTLAETLAAAERVGADGVGFSVPAGGGLVAVDLDDCRDATTGELTAAAAGILDDLTGTYAEVSPSGRGLRMFARGYLARRGRVRAKIPGLGWGGRPASVELSAGRQFVTVTGDRVADRPLTLTD